MSIEMRRQFMTELDETLNQRDMKWISVKDRPLVRWSAEGVWTCTTDGYMVRQKYISQ